MDVNKKKIYFNQVHFISYLDKFDWYTGQFCLLRFNQEYEEFAWVPWDPPKPSLIFLKMQDCQRYPVPKVLAYFTRFDYLKLFSVLFINSFGF